MGRDLDLLLKALDNDPTVQAWRTFRGAFVKVTGRENFSSLGDDFEDLPIVKLYNKIEAEFYKLKAIHPF